MSDRNGHLSESRTVFARLAYLIDMQTIQIMDLLTNTKLATISHDTRVDWMVRVCVCARVRVRVCACVLLIAAACVCVWEFMCASDAALAVILKMAFIVNVGPTHEAIW